MIVAFIQRSSVPMPQTKDDLTIQVVNRPEPGSRSSSSYRRHSTSMTPTGLNLYFWNKKNASAIKIRFFSTPAGKPGLPDADNVRSGESAHRSMNCTCSATRTRPGTSAAWKRKMMRMSSKPCLRWPKTGSKPKACSASPGRSAFPSTKSADY